MSLVNVTNVVVLDNPTQFTNPFQFEITFECLQDLAEGTFFLLLFRTINTHSSTHSLTLLMQLDLEWKVIYVGSSESSDFDQTLEEVLVGPVTAGCHKFVLQADAPDASKLLEGVLGVTVVLITCSYNCHEFVRIGYYVNNEMTIIDPTTTTALDENNDIMVANGDSNEENTAFCSLHKIVRTTLADKPRVTRFAIPWQDMPQSLMTPPPRKDFIVPLARMVSPMDDMAMEL
jgi:histone chaperone ASF1